MMGYLIVSPVGTSTLQNFARDPRYRDLVERYGAGDWYRLSPDDPRNRVPDGYVCSVVRGHELYVALLDFLERAPRTGSAEINGILATAETFSLNIGDCEVLLYTTATCSARLCASLVADVLREVYGARAVQVVEIRALRSVDDFDEGLAEVLDRVARIVVDRKRRGYKVYVSATPGFKSETTFFVIASILAGADAVTYIHESFRSAIALPIPPLSLDREYLERIVKIFGDRQCVDKGALLAAGISEAEIVSLADRAVLKTVHGDVCLRPWIRKLIEILYPR